MRDQRIRRSFVFGISAVAFAYSALCITYLLIKRGYIEYEGLNAVRFLMVCTFCNLLATLGLLAILYGCILEALARAIGAPQRGTEQTSAKDM